MMAARFTSFRSFSNLPPRAEYTKLSLGTKEDYKRSQAYFAMAATPEKLADRMLTMVHGLKGIDMGCQVDLYEHSLQTATRALEDGANDELVVCGLLHDVGELLVPACHGEVAAALLRPYISEENHWILSHHEIFQAYYYGEACGIDKNIRDRFQGHQHFRACERFCEKYDQEAFDPTFKSLTLSEFRPLLVRLLQRSPYSQPSSLDLICQAKKALQVYDFHEWNATKYESG